jgi:hypothetical protein
MALARLALILAISLSGGLSSAFAAKYRVNNTPGTSPAYANLQTAINSVSTGDTLIVEHSETGYGSITINKDISLYGTGYFLADNPNNHKDLRTAKVTGVTFTAQGSGALFSGFEVLGNITVNASSVDIERCRIVGTVTVGSGGSIANFKLRQCFIEANQSILVDLVNAGNYKISNCLLKNDNPLNSAHIVRHTTGSGVVLNNVFFGAPKSTFKNSTIQDNYFRDAIIDIAGSSGNTVRHNAANSAMLNAFGNPTNLNVSLLPFYLANQDSVFSFNQTASRDGRYDLNPTWPTNPLRVSGFGGGEIGMYGTSYSYVLSGLPSIPSIYDYVSAPQGTPNTGVNVTVKGKGNK